jgi:hypothetical protein
MAKKKDQQFRVAKINIIKSLARKPKGMLRKELVFKDKKAYSRRKEKQELEKVEKEELE